MIKVKYQREYIDNVAGGSLCVERVIILPSPQAARSFIRKINPLRVRRDEHGNRVRDSHAQLTH